MAHGPENDLYKWAGHYATERQTNRSQATEYHLVNKGLTLCEKEIAAKDSAIAVKDTIITYQTGRIEFYAYQLRKCQERKPMRLVWFGAGVVAGWFTKQELED